MKQPVRALLRCDAIARRSVDEHSPRTAQTRFHASTSIVPPPRLRLQCAESDVWAGDGSGRPGATCERAGSVSLAPAGAEAH